MGSASATVQRPAVAEGFAAELRERIREAAEAGRRHDEALRTAREEVRQRLERLEEVIAFRCTEAVRISEGHLLTQNPILDEAGNRTYSLHWVGPGGERSLSILVNPERQLLQYRWFGDWKDQGVAYTVEPLEIQAFDVRELLRRFVDAAPWLRRQFPLPLDQ
ncbi:MAG TPA: hypothetical protein VH257_20505 [Chloroflexota bacterium]|nr:hypothetical protein [Chloroflexota bacterium]